MKRIALLGALAVAAGCAQTPPAPSPEARAPAPSSEARAPAPSPEARAQLAPSGTLRVAVLTSNPIIGAKDAASGELKGTTVDLGRALAALAGVQARMIEYAAIPKLMEDAAANAWDVAVVAIDPARRGIGARVGGDVPSPAHPPSGCRFHTRCPEVFERCPRQEPLLYPVGDGASRCFLSAPAK